MDRFGRIDVLVNNAANFYAGFFEELSPEQMERQLSTSLIGPMNVTRAVLPAMRKQRSGLIMTISSTAGLIGFEFGTAYAASKFGLEGWMQSLQAEIEPFGIHTITVNPGFFRTELLTEESTNFAKRTIDDYNERRAKQMEFWKGYSGQQSGDPTELAQELRYVRIAIDNSVNVGIDWVPVRICVHNHRGWRVCAKACAAQNIRIRAQSMLFERQYGADLIRKFENGFLTLGLKLRR